MKRINLFLLALLFSTLTACGGGDDGYGGDAPPPAGEGDTPPPSGEGTTPPVDITISSVVITTPNESLVDNEDGTYSKMYTIGVYDQDGSPATNGVRVDLQVVDTVLAIGSITDLNPDTASGTNLTIPGVIQTDATPATLADNPLADLTTASVTRPGLSGGSIRQIHANDLVIMTGPGEEVLMSTGLELGQVDSRDVVRTIASVPTISDQLTVSSLYNASYPNYGGTNYYIAASMVGAGITGEDSGGVPTQSHTVTTDSLGTAKVWITYPADIEHIHLGCAPDQLDDRVSPMGSSKPMFIATAGGVSNTRPFCFFSMAGYNLSAVPNALTIGGPVTVCVRDGSNGGGVRVPFTPVSWGQSGDAIVASPTFVTGTPSITEIIGGTPFTTYYTNEYGCIGFTLLAAGAAGTSATFSVYAGDGKADITVDIP